MGSVLHTFTVPDEIGNDFHLSFPGDDRVFAVTNEQLSLLRLSDAAVLAKKKLKYSHAPLPFGSDKLAVRQSFKKAPLLLDARSLKTLVTLSAHKKTMSGNLALDPTGRYAATGGDGGEILLHDLQDAPSPNPPPRDVRQSLPRFVFPKWPGQRNNPPIDSLAFSHDGKHLVAYASDLKGQVRVLSVPDLKEVFVSRTDDQHALRTWVHLSKDREEIVLQYEYYGDDEDWKKWDIVKIGEKTAKPWTGTWKERDDLTPELRGTQHHLLYMPLVPTDEPLQPFKVLYVGKKVRQTYSWGSFEGFLSDRTLYYWDNTKPLPGEIEQAGEGEAFLEVFVEPKGNHEAVAKELGGAIKLEPGIFPEHGRGRLAHGKLDRAKAIAIRDRTRSMPHVSVSVL